MLRARSTLTLCFTLLFAALLLVSASFADPTPNQPRTSSLDITVTIHGAIDSLPTEAEILLRPEDEGNVSPVVVTVPLEGKVGSASLAVDLSRAWIARASVEGYWSPEARTSPGSTNSRTVLALSLWPATTLKARLVPPKDGTVPTVAKIRLAPTETVDPQLRQPDGSHWVDCRVERRQLDECTVPEGRWNLRIDSGDYSPYYAWDVLLTPSIEYNLDRVVLRRGGSIVGRALSTLGPLDPKKAVVELQPVIDPGEINPSTKQQLAQLRRRADLGQWGDFQFVGVPPGLYHVEVRQEDFSPAVSSAVLVRDAKETRLEDPMVLDELLHLTVQVSPSTDPFGEVWKANLHREIEASTMKQVASGTLDPNGSWKSPSLPTGPYSLQLLDQRGNSLGWWDVDLEEGTDFFAVDLPIVYLDGRVELGDDPLPSTVWFGGKTGEERVETETDEDGEFYAVLPRDGAWRVDVEADSPPVMSRGLQVEIEADESLRTATTVIEVPDTRIEGEVVDDAGLPVQSADIQFQSYGDWRGVLNADADPSGRFDLRGMQPGQFSIEASSPGGRSEPEIRQVAEGQAVTVRLVIQRQKKMAGTVVSDTGPVLAARVIAIPFNSAGRPASMRMAATKTDAKGQFELSIPGSSAVVRLMVMAPGYALYLGSVTEGQDLQISLSRAMGTLRLDGSELHAGEIGLVLVEGKPVSTFRLDSWALLNGATKPPAGSLIVPGMPPGSYAFCKVTTEEALAVFGGVGVPTGTSCTQGFLSAGDELALDLGK